MSLKTSRDNDDDTLQRRTVARFPATTGLATEVIGRHGRALLPEQRPPALRLALR
jgi:hypothetical protein